jgi:hypothetical protein
MRLLRITAVSLFMIPRCTSLVLVLSLGACASPQESWQPLPAYSGPDAVEYEVHSIHRKDQLAEITWRVSFRSTDGRSYTELWHDEFSCTSKERRILGASLTIDGKLMPYENAAQALPGPWHTWTGESFGFVPGAALTRLACSSAS